MSSSSSPNRPFRVIHGLAYPQLYHGAKQPRSVKARPPSENGERHAYYTDDAIRLSASDATQFVGKPICVEHLAFEHLQRPVGVITSAWMDSDKHMRVNGRIWTDTEEGRWAFDQVKCGKLAGLSVGYTPQLRSNQVDYKLFDEISLVETPFFKGASVRIVASKNEPAPKFNSTERKNPTLFFRVMASEQNNNSTPPPPSSQSAGDQPKPPRQEDRDAEELLRHTDKTSQLIQEKDKELEQLRARTAQFELIAQEYEELRKEKEAQEAKRRAERQKEGEEAAKQFIANHKRLHGEDAEIPEHFVEQCKELWSTRGSENLTSVYASSPVLASQLQEQIDELRAKVTATNSTLNQINATQQQRQNRVNASMGEVLRKTANSAETRAENANQPKGEKEKRGAFDHLFVYNPSAQDQELYGEQIDSIRASGGNFWQTDITKLPRHQHLDAVPNSARFHSPGIFDFLHKKGDVLEKVPLRGLKIDYGEENPPMGGMSY